MNKTILIGNLANEPEYAYTTESGVPYCKFTLAVNRHQSKEGKKDADFIRIVVWRELADVCVKYLHKGKKVSVVGRIETNDYIDESGTRHYYTNVVAEEVEFLTPKDKE